MLRFRKLTNAHCGDWTGLNFTYALSSETSEFPLER